MLLNLSQLMFYIYTFLLTRETLQLHLLEKESQNSLDLELPTHLRRVILGLTKHVPSVIKLSQTSWWMVRRRPESGLTIFENLMDKS